MILIDQNNKNTLINIVFEYPDKSWFKIIIEGKMYHSDNYILKYINDNYYLCTKR